MTMTFVNGRIVAADGTYPTGWLRVDGRRIAAMGSGRPPRGAGDPVIDVDGKYVAPGFIDTHVHGAGGYELMEVEPDCVPDLSRFLVRYGVTSFTPTTLTASHEDTMRALGHVAQHAGSIEGGATNLGAHMEGPYLNPGRKGAHPEELIRPADRQEVDDYLDTGILRKMTLAPEIDANGWLIDELVARGVTVTAGHTDATFEQMHAAAARGATVVTHVFNAMRGFHHREAGAVGAALTIDGLRCEVIADTYHVGPPAMRLLWRVKGVNGVVIVTDATKAAGMPDGVRDRFGRLERVEGGVARLEDGTIRGSVTLIDQGFRNFCGVTGAAIEDAWPVVSLNPARSIGVADRKGSLEVGKDADIVVLAADGAVTDTFVEGRRVYPV